MAPIQVLVPLNILALASHTLPLQAPVSRLSLLGLLSVASCHAPSTTLYLPDGISFLLLNQLPAVGVRRGSPIWEHHVS